MLAVYDKLKRNKVKRFKVEKMILKKMVYRIGCAVILFIFSIAYFLPAAANALTIDSLSQTQGSVLGGEENTLGGSGFISLNNDKIKHVYAGAFNSFALTEGGELFAWGRNDSGQLGLGDTTDRKLPEKVDLDEKIIGVAAGSYHTLVFSETGKVFSWGRNTNGQLGLGDNANYTTPQDITAQFGIEKVVQISAGEYSSYAISESGKVYSFGGNLYGQLGDGTSIDKNTPQEISANFGGQTVKSISSGWYHVMAMSDSDNIFAWGLGQNGRLGNGSTLNVAIPANITANFGGAHIKAISPNGNHSTAISEDGKFFAWGHNSYGQLGAGDTTTRSLPFLVNNFGGESISKIFRAYDNSIAISDSGKIYSWARNQYGQVGDGTNIDKNLPQDISSAFTNRVIEMVGGGRHMLALTDAGEVFAWGSDNTGQLGTGGSTDINIPENITANVNVTQIEVLQVKEIYFGDSKVKQFEIIDGKTIRLIVPAHSAGIVDVKLVGLNGDVQILPQSYEYIDEAYIEAPNTGFTK